MEWEPKTRDEAKMEEDPRDPEIDTEMEAPVAELLGTSLHAIVGAPSPKTMKLIEKLNPCIDVLIIICNTHSFINVNVT